MYYLYTKFNQVCSHVLFIYAWKISKNMKFCPDNKLICIEALEIHQRLEMDQNGFSIYSQTP